MYITAPAREALTDDWQTTREIWQRAGIGSESSYQKILHQFVVDGEAESMQCPLDRYPGMFSWVFRRKQNANPA